MARIIYTPEKKEEILKAVAAVGAAKAAKENGVSYATVLKWAKEASGAAIEEGKKAVKTAAKVVEDVSVGALESINAQIEATEADIEQLSEELAAKKAALKDLQKAKAKAEKILEKQEEMRKAEEERAQVLDALKNSDKSLEEILAFLEK